AGGIEPFAVDPPDQHRVVDVQPRAGLKPDRLEADVGGARLPSRGDQQFLGDDDRTVRHLEADPALRVPFDAGGGGPEQHPDVASRLVHGFASRRPGTGGTMGTVPVARVTAWRAESSIVPPPGWSTTTHRSPASLPLPRTRSIPCLSSHRTWPSSFHPWAKW